MRTPLASTALSVSALAIGGEVALAQAPPSPGEFIHTRPDGMKKLVIARGKLRMTFLGIPLIEAHEVNRVSLE
jgi:hypothetical protein